MDDCISLYTMCVCMYVYIYIYVHVLISVYIYIFKSYAIVPALCNPQAPQWHGQP